MSWETHLPLPSNISTPSSRTSGLRLRHHWLSLFSGLGVWTGIIPPAFWASRMQTADGGTVQPPQLCEIIFHNISPSKYLYVFIYLSVLLILFFWRFLTNTISNSTFMFSGLRIELGWRQIVSLFLLITHIQNSKQYQQRLSTKDYLNSSICVNC